MARRSGTFRQGFLATHILTTAAVDAWLTLMDTDVGTATNVILTVSVSTAALNAGLDTYTHKLSFTLSSDTLAKAKSQVAAAITTCMEAIVVTHSNYATIDVIDVSVSATMSN